jgi:hypothetical protein
MNKYALKNSFGETITYTIANSLIEAQEYFSKIKRLNLYDLLTIFDVVRVDE